MMWRHDCDRCHFLGTEDNHDLYVCDKSVKGLGPSVIARYGDKGAEYLSMPWKVIEDAGQGVPPILLDAVREILRVFSVTLGHRASDFDRYVYEHATKSLLANIEGHANRILREELKGPFLLLKVVPRMDDRSITWDVRVA